jgi:hypothetical protein
MAAEVQQQWKKEAKKVQPILQQLNRKLSVSSPPTEHALAVNQLDAEILDKELSDILRSQFMRIFTFFKVRKFGLVGQLSRCRFQHRPVSLCLAI